jgi:hypothetical protein
MHPSPDQQQLEGRASKRYPLRLSVMYCGLGREFEVSGSGRTVDISSCGIFLTTDSRALPTPGTRVEVRLDWPALLGGVTPLRLVAEGVVVRSTPQGFALRYKHHKFLTRKREQGSAGEEPNRMFAG